MRDEGIPLEGALCEHGVNYCPICSERPDCALCDDLHTAVQTCRACGVPHCAEKSSTRFERYCIFCVALAAECGWDELLDDEMDAWRDQV